MVTQAEKQKIWRDKNPERSREIGRNHLAHQRQRVFEILGSACVRCGFSDPRALQVDHRNGGGAEERRKVHGSPGVYRRILAGHAADYQILCANCNWIKRYEREEW